MDYEGFLNLYLTFALSSKFVLFPPICFLITLVIHFFICLSVSFQFREGQHLRHFQFSFLILDTVVSPLHCHFLTLPWLSFLFPLSPFVPFLLVAGLVYLSVLVPFEPFLLIDFYA